MKFPFNPKYKAASIFDFPQLQLKKDEVARISALDENVVVGVSHWVQLGENNKNNGYYTCSGNYETMFGDGTHQGQGSDPEHCKFCKVAQRNSAVGVASRRFVLNVVQYLTDARGQLRQPLSIEVVVWRFGDDKYNRLVDISQTYGNLQALDLLVKCEQQQFQRLQIDPVPADKCLWRTNGIDWARWVATQFKSQARNESDLQVLLGNKLDDAQADKLIAEALGIGLPPVSLPTLADPLAVQNLLDNAPVAAPRVVAPTSVPVPQPVVQSPRLVPVAPVLMPEPVAPVPTTPAPTAPVPQVPSVADFDALLKTV